MYCLFRLAAAHQDLSHPSYLLILNGDAGDWTWDHLHGTQMLCQWAAALRLGPFLTLQKNTFYETKMALRVFANTGIQTGLLSSAGSPSFPNVWTAGMALPLTFENKKIHLSPPPHHGRLTSFSATGWAMTISTIQTVVKVTVWRLCKCQQKCYPIWLPQDI